MNTVPPATFRPLQPRFSSSSHGVPVLAGPSLCGDDGAGVAKAADLVGLLIELWHEPLPVAPVADASDILYIYE